MTHAPVEDRIIERPAEAANHVVVLITQREVIKLPELAAVDFADHQTTRVVIAHDVNGVDGRLQHAI